MASARLAALREQYKGRVEWNLRSFPTLLGQTAPAPRVLERCVSQVLRAKREPEGARLSPELWLTMDPPHSSLPALTALEAARLEGSAALRALSEALMRAAQEQSVNVSRTDVLFELANRVGLKMNRFEAAFGSQPLRSVLEAEHRFAAQRGVCSVPTIVIAERWMIRGLRTPEEYQRLIDGCLAKADLEGQGGRERTVH